jgi:hypothetical protein
MAGSFDGWAHGEEKERSAGSFCRRTGRAEDGRDLGVEHRAAELSYGGHGIELGRQENSTVRSRRWSSGMSARRLGGTRPRDAGSRGKGNVRRLQPSRQAARGTREQRDAAMELEQGGRSSKPSSTLGRAHGGERCAGELEAERIVKNLAERSAISSFLPSACSAKFFTMRSASSSPAHLSPP